jgi:sporulation protein YhbH
MSVVGSSGLPHDAGHRDAVHHRERLRRKIAERLKDRIGEEDIIASGPDKRVRVPIPGTRSWRFIHDRGSEHGVAQGDGEPGDVIGPPGPASDRGEAGTEPGEELYEVWLDMEDVEELLFSELALPRLKPKTAADVEATEVVFDDVARKGPQVDKKATLRENLMRNAKRGRLGLGGIESDDVRYHSYRERPMRRHRAVIFLAMDVSGSMDIGRKRMARLFFYWCVRFLRQRYEQTEIVFVAHTTEAREVAEHEFFNRMESGGTRVSSAFEVIERAQHDRYPESDWNVYVLHVSDGDNFTADNVRTLRLIGRLAERCSLVGYLEVGGRERGYGLGASHTLLAYCEQAMPGFDGFVFAHAADDRQLWPALKRFFANDERCRVIAAEDLGFDVPDVVYHLAGAEEVYYAAANGLPARYSSARWGARFDETYGRYRRGEERIYELIFNTRPVHAYLMEGNSLVGQTLVIAHCLGHGYVFEHNTWLAAVDRQIMPRVLSAAQRIADYMAAHGRERVERFLESCHAIAVHQPQAQLVRPAQVPEPEYRTGDYDGLFPDDVEAERRRVVEERAALRRRFPRQPQEDLLGFIERHARALEDWQRDVMSIVHSEQSYFLPQMRTKILNEGAAVLLHQEVCQRLFLPSHQYWEYEQLNAAVVQPRPGPVNPYNLGIALMREVMRIATDPDDEERERWSWAGEADPFDRVRTVLGSYDDDGLLREFLTARVCELCRLFAYDRDTGRLRVTSREADAVREALIGQLSTFAIPHVEIVDADFRGRGELLLEHRHEGIGLDSEYARGTLAEVAMLWGKPCVVRTVRGRDADRELWFTAWPNGTTQESLRGPGGDG